MAKFRKIYDPIHRFIHIDSTENELIESRPFQRLQYIHQLGVSFLVYPSATHRRYEHSLGVMEVSSQIYDSLTSPRPTSKKMEILLKRYVPKRGSKEDLYWRRIVRLAALCHDLGHLPFSHAAEKKLLDIGGHEKWTFNMIKSDFLVRIWQNLKEEYRKQGIDKNPTQDIIKVALGEKMCRALKLNLDDFTPWDRVVSSIITGDFFGADRIDYLLRDAQYTGLAYGVFDYHQLIEMLRIVPSFKDNEVLTIGIDHQGMASCEALLLARHYMQKRIYQYESVKSYTFHLARFMNIAFPWLKKDLSTYINTTDNEVMAAINQAAFNTHHPAHMDAKRIYFKKNIYISIPVPPQIGKQKLEEFRKSLEVQEEEMAWDLFVQDNPPLSSSFPVLFKDNLFEPGSWSSDVTINRKNRNWLYVAPRLEPVVRKYLNSRKKKNEKTRRLF